MTFVAHPYERFVDDLLIALTGGTIREEHEFQGVDRAYALGRPGVVVESLRVFGQRDQEFAVFEPGVDFRYDDVEDGLFWQPDGRPPDERTQFYVSYFTEDRVDRLTDRNPGSVTAVIGEAFARLYGVLHKEMELIYASGFVDLASGSALDHLVRLLDIERKDAKFASGEALFRRSTPAPGDIAIPPGTLVSTAEAQVFETTAPRTLRRDQLSVVVPVRAQLEGPPGQVPAGAITVINRPIYGVESVLNERPTFFAAERETDDELRQRLRGTIHRAGRSTVEAIRNSLVEGVPDLAPTNLQITERPETPGVVEVRLAVTDGADELFVRRVDDAIFQSRPAGVRVSHNLSAPLPATGPVAETPDGQRERADVVADFRSSGALEEPASLAAEGGPTDTVLALQVEVLLRLVEPNATPAEREAVEDAVRDAVTGYVEGLPMGAPLIHAKLLGSIAAADEIADATLLVGPRSGATRPEHRGNVIAAGRKLAIDAHDIAVHLMDQRVRLDVRVRLEERAGSDPATLPAPGTEATVVRGAVERVVSPGTRTLSRTEVRGAVSEALAASAPELLVAERDGVVVNATYEESGRLVSDAADVALEEHELAVLGRVDVERVGALDG